MITKYVRIWKFTFIWNFRLRGFNKLRFTQKTLISLCVCKLPLFTKWIYLGTEKGNIFVVNLETFDLSGYQIMWNQTIPKSQKVHPGPVTALEEHPVDPSKLLIGTSYSFKVVNMSLLNAEYCDT